MKKLKGSLTVEASIVLPLFLMAILSVMYIIKIIFIHESVQYALAETADEIANYAYVLEKTEILNAQQEIYRDAHEKVNDFNSHVGKIINNMEVLYATIEGGSSYISDQLTYDNTCFVDMPATENLNDYINNYVNQIMEVKERIVGDAETAYNSFSTIIHSVESILESVKGTLINECLVEGLGVTNNYIGSKTAELLMNRYITDEQYKKWYIVDGKKGMDFKHSTFMLDNEDIDLVVTYKVAIPIPFPGIKEIPMMQRVKVRGWTGNGNCSTIYTDVGTEKDIDDNNNTIVYSVNNEKYHLYITCLRKETIPVRYNQSDYPLTLCKICGEGINRDDLITVYRTLSRPKNPEDKIHHVDLHCWEIYKKDVKELTLKEANDSGRTVCKICDKKRKRMESE